MSLADTCDQLDEVSAAWLLHRDAMPAMERFAVEGWLNTLVKLGEEQINVCMWQHGHREPFGIERFEALKKRVEGL